MPRCTIATVVSMLSTILVAVPAFSRVEPAMTSGPTAGEMTMSTKVCSSVPGQQVRKTILTPFRRARVSAPRTNCVIPLAEMPTSTSLRVGCRRATARAPSSKLSSTPACDRKNAARPPAMIAWTRCIGVLNVGPISAASRTPSRPLVPAPTKIRRPPLWSEAVMRSEAVAMRAFSRATAVRILRSSRSIRSIMSSVDA